MANHHPIVVDGITGGPGGTQSVYYLDSSAGLLTRIGDPLPIGETIPAGPATSNYCTNAGVQVGDYIYVFVKGVVFRYDLNNPSADWTIYHTVSTPPTNFHHYKAGLFVVVIDGQDYLIGACVLDISNVIAFKINLSTDAITTRTLAFAIAGGAVFRNSLVFKGKLFFTTNVVATPLICYEPISNILTTVRFPTTPAAAIPSLLPRHCLVPFNNVLYDIGVNSTGLGQEGSIWQFDEYTLSFSFVNAMLINHTTLNTDTVHDAAFVQPSTRHINSLSGNFATQSIFYLNFGPDPMDDPTLRGWRLFEIYPKSDGTFDFFNWNSAPSAGERIPSGFGYLASEGIPSLSGWHVTPHPNERSAGGGDDTRLFLYYNEDRTIAGFVDILEFLPEVQDLFLDHPRLSTLSMRHTGWGQAVMPYVLDGSGDKLFSDQIGTATARIEQIERVPNGFQLSFTLWSDSASTLFNIGFFFSVDAEAPKTPCTLSNPTSGFIDMVDTGSIPYIVGLIADDGATLYSVTWEADTDNAPELEYILLNARVWSGDFDSGDPDNFSPAYIFKNIKDPAVFGDSLSSTIAFKHLPLINQVDSLSESIGFIAELSPNIDETITFTAAAEASKEVLRSVTESFAITASADADVLLGLSFDGLILAGKAVLAGQFTHASITEKFITWREFSPTGTWQNVNYSGSFRLLGDILEARMRINILGIPTGGVLNIDLPSHTHIDYNKINSITGKTPIGQAFLNIGSTDYIAYPVIDATSTNPEQISLVAQEVSGVIVTLGDTISPVVPLSWGANDHIEIYYKVPISII